MALQRNPFRELDQADRAYSIGETSRKQYLRLIEVTYPSTGFDF